MERRWSRDLRLSWLKEENTGALTMLLNSSLVALTSVLTTQLSLQMPDRDAVGAIKVIPCDLLHSSAGS